MAIHPFRLVTAFLPLDGWHSFRRSVASKLMRSGESAKLVAGILGNRVETMLKYYDLPEVENYRDSLAEVAGDLLPAVTKSASAASEEHASS